MGGWMSKEEPRKFKPVTDTKIAVEQLQLLVQKIQPGNLTNAKRILNQYDNKVANIIRNADQNVTSANRNSLRKKTTNIAKDLESQIADIMKVLAMEKRRLNGKIIPRIQNLQQYTKPKPKSSNRK
jgi:hypothetical protein